MTGARAAKKKLTFSNKMTFKIQSKLNSFGRKFQWKNQTMVLGRRATVAKPMQNECFPLSK